MVAEPGCDRQWRAPQEQTSEKICEQIVDVHVKISSRDRILQGLDVPVLEMVEPRAAPTRHSSESVGIWGVGGAMSRVEQSECCHCDGRCVRLLTGSGWLESCFLRCQFDRDVFRGCSYEDLHDMTLEALEDLMIHWGHYFWSLWFLFLKKCSLSRLCPVIGGEF